MELCQVLGCPHPEDLERPPWNLTWRKFEDWLAWWEINPWGQVRADMRAAVPWGIIGALFDPTAQPPNALFPYWDAQDQVQIDVDASFDAMQAHLIAYGYLDDDTEAEDDGQGNQQP